MKLKSLLSLLFLLFCFLSANADVKKDAFVVVIDPGHGGKDSGAVGKRGKEKDINLAVSLLLGKYIRSNHPDVKVVYTRNKDVFIGLDERANVANKEHANLFISIHTNAIRNKNAIHGAEVFTFGLTRLEENLEVAKRENSVILLEDNYEEKYEGFDNSAESYIMFTFMQNKFVEQSIDFASLVQKELVKTADRANRGVKQAQYLVLRKSSMPRILIELDFISNREAENFMLSKKGQEKMALSISNAFTQYKRDFDQKIQKNAVKYSADNAENQKQPETLETKTITYKVQILASPERLPKKSRSLKGYPADFYEENNLYKYTVGETSDWKEISKLRKTVSKDFKDAFIVTFENGKRVRK